MRNKLSPLILLVALSALCLGAISVELQQQEVEIKTIPVAGTVSYLEGQGGNIGLCSGPDGLVMVDSQFARLGEKIRAAMAAVHPDSKGQPKFLVNTHWHGDHVGGNELFGATTTILAHTNVRQRLTTPMPWRGGMSQPKPKAAWPVVTFEDSINLHANGETIKVIHLPKGHTDGDSIVMFMESKVVHMGDLYFRNRFPFVDLESGGDVFGYMENVEYVHGLIDDSWKVIPGHGALSNREELGQFHRMLEQTIDIARRGLAAGKSKEEMVQEGLPAQWDSWGKGFINTRTWIETLHTGLKP